jgi:alanine-glyoxylate transaminase/serine-glyoxylate transaminase/serine-pyruvate transaminase
MSSAPAPFIPPSRLLLGPGPSPIDPRILQAFTRPTLGHLDPIFLKLMDEVRGMLKQVFRTQNELTFPVSGTGTAGMETCLVNLIEPGDEVVVCVQGYFGARMADIAGRAGRQGHGPRREVGRRVRARPGRAAPQGKERQGPRDRPGGNLDGYNQPVKEFAELAHKHGALIVVDAVTSTGGIPVEVDAWGIDAIYTGHAEVPRRPARARRRSASARARSRSSTSASRRSRAGTST